MAASSSLLHYWSTVGAEPLMHFIASQHDLDVTLWHNYPWSAVFMRTDRHSSKGAPQPLVELDDIQVSDCSGGFGRWGVQPHENGCIRPGQKLRIWTLCLHWSALSPPCFPRPHPPVWRALPLEAAAYPWLAWTTLPPAAKLQPSSLCVNSWRRLFWRFPHPSPPRQSSASCPLQPTTSSSTWWDWKKWCRTC